MAKFVVTIVRNAEQIKEFVVVARSKKKAEEIVNSHIENDTLDKLELTEESIDEVNDNVWDVLSVERGN